MNTHRSVRLPLAGAIALVLLGATAVAAAQTMPQQPNPPPPPAQVPLPPPPPPPAMSMPAQPQSAPAPPATPMPTQPATPSPPPDASMPTQSATSMSQPASPQQGAAGGFYQGTESSATYPIQNGTLVVNAGMPAQVQQYGPPPAFKSLDTNHDGRISQTEAQAYPPLDSDFLYASGGGNSISHSQYEKWVKLQH